MYVMVQVHQPHRDLGIVFNTSKQLIKPHGLNLLDKILSHGFLIDADHR